MNRKNRVCSAALSAVLTLTLVTAPAQALDSAGAERTEGGYAVMQAVSGLSIGEIDSSGIIATIATTPKASLSTLPPSAVDAPIINCSMNVAVIGPEATPPESKAIAV